jgi:type II secretory pathway component PulK
MKNSDGTRNPRGLIIICVALLAVIAVPLLSSARTQTTSVNIVNNSNREIRNVYLSPVNTDDWSSNQLDHATIPPGQSFALNNVACDQQQVKVIGEDQDGCFLSTVVTCGDSATWTITNDTARDCGGDN